MKSVIPKKTLLGIGDKGPVLAGLKALQDQK
jgi:hypothetical protein